MKKFLVIFIILVAIPAAIFADVFDLSAGVDLKLKPTAVDILGDYSDWKFAGSDIMPGLAVNAKVFLFNFDATMDFDFKKNEATSLSTTGFAGAGLSFDVFFIRLSLGAGYTYYFDINKDSDKKIDVDLRSYDAEDLKSSRIAFKSFKEASIDVRAGIDCLLGDFSVGGYLVLPTELSLSNLKLSDLSSDGLIGCIKGTTGGLRVMYHF